MQRTLLDLLTMTMKHLEIWKWKENSPLCDFAGFKNTCMKLLRHVSFVDCPGHDILMATMLNGVAIMDRGTAFDCRQ